MSESEVARIRRQIALEYESAQLGLTGPAIVSRHDFIQKRMEGIADCHKQLVKLVGEQEAMEMIVEISSNIPKKQHGAEDAAEVQLIAFQTLPEELSALDEIVTKYVDFLLAKIPESQDRSLVITFLHSLQLRLQKLLPCSPGCLISFQLSINEANVLRAAVYGYQQLLQAESFIAPQEGSALALAKIFEQR